VFWSHLIPGLGQMVERRFGIGILLFVLAGIASAPDAPWLQIPLGLAVTFAAVAEAFRRSRLGPAAPRAARAFLIATVAFGLAGPLVAVVLRARFVQAFRHPSESMLPTLHSGDYFFVDKTRAGRAAVGDLLVFRYPADRTKDFVKRCVAVAGQTVEIRDRDLFVDGAPVNEPWAIHVDPNVHPADPADPRDHLQPTVVPPGHVFVLGDNRDNSNDSRFWGPLALSDVKGRALRIYWPPDRLDALRPPARRP
jgi:signal peptidase I